MISFKGIEIESIPTLTGAAYMVQVKGETLVAATVAECQAFINAQLLTPDEAALLMALSRTEPVTEYDRFWLVLLTHALLNPADDHARLRADFAAAADHIATLEAENASLKAGQA